uniref:Uncharacterized protein n=1 Tax=Arundo donax TaxID=35708 RepID=A0A0A9G7C4_ARUDO
MDRHGRGDVPAVPFAPAAATACRHTWQGTVRLGLEYRCC